MDRVTLCCHPGLSEVKKGRAADLDKQALCSRLNLCPLPAFALSVSPPTSYPAIFRPAATRVKTVKHRPHHKSLQEQRVSAAFYLPSHSLNGMVEASLRAPPGTVVVSNRRCSATHAHLTISDTSMWQLWPARAYENVKNSVSTLARIRRCT